MASKGKQESAAERRIKALELRKGGATYRQIGQTLKVSEAQAYKDVRAALAALNKLEQAEAEELRRLELERLDAMTLAVWPQVTKGHQGAIDRALKIMQRRADLLGLDAPRQVAHTGDVGIKIYERSPEFDPDSA